MRKIMKKIVIASLSAALVTTVAMAYEIHHPNLRDAHHDAEMGINHVQNAQQGNKGVEFGGHAEKAIDLLRQAQAEIVEADKWNDAHRH
jgi:peptidoglycan hydrolase CwlO-like protein